ncbi:MAG: DMT family transporter [Albidovulum sp.]
MSDAKTDLAARNRLIGLLSVLGAVFLFSTNDVAIKFLSDDYALHQIVLIRSLIALGVILGLLLPFNGGFGTLRSRRLGMHAVRGLCVVVANMSFFTALAAMPLAEAVAIFFISPLLITAFSVVFLGEKVGARRWAAVVVGLIGVIVMLRPGTETFRLVALLPLLAAVAYAALHILTRKIGGTENAITMAFYIQIVFIAVSGAMGVLFGDGRFAGTGDASADFLLRAWVWPNALDWPVLVFLGVANAFAGVFISQAYRLTEAALIAPFEYIAMPLAVFWGVVMFSEWPDAVSWIGIAFIVGAGLYVFLREAVLSHQDRVRRRPVRR